MSLLRSWKEFLWVGFVFSVAITAYAEEWPSKSVRFVSPYPPGGSGDTLARLFAAKLTDSLGQQFIVENRTGASGIIGTDFVAKSPPDGYTWVFVFDAHAVHQALNPRLPFDPDKDFAPVMIIGRAPMVITTGVSKPYKSFGDVVTAEKARPGTIAVGNVGNGSLAHLTTILVSQAAGISLVPVAYRGGGPLSADLMGGQVDLAMASTAAQAQYVRGGKMRAIVLTGEKRSPTMPDVPTLTESGYPISAYAWWGILAPARTPRPIINKLHSEILNAINMPDVNKTLTGTLGIEVMASRPEEAQKWIRSQMERWGQVVKQKNIHAE